MAGRLKLKFVGAWLAIVLTIGVFVPYWHYSDAWILTDIIGAAQSATIDAMLAPIDLDAPAGTVRQAALRLLTAICQPLRNPARGTESCARPGTQLPKTIAFDIIFVEGAGDRRLTAPLVHLIETLRAANVDVYAAAAIDPADRPVAAIRTAVNAIGHTRISFVPFIPTAFAWYPPTVDRIEALPYLVSRGSANLTDVDRSNRIFPLGPPKTFTDASWSTERIARALRGRTDELHGKTLLIGNVRTDVRTPSGRSGFELVSWALSERIAPSGWAAKSTVDTRLMMILVVAASGLAALLYTSIFRAVRARPFCYSIAYSGATTLTLAAIAGVDFVLLSFHAAVPQLSLAMIGGLTAAGCGARSTSEDVAHERFLRKLHTSAEHNADELFDVFISYARDQENSTWVIDHVYDVLAGQTRENGEPLRIFFDRASIRPGNDWYEKIVRSVVASRCFVPVYSRSYFARWFCRDEMELANLCRREKPDFIIPVTRIGYRLPKRYAAIQAIDANAPSLRTDLIRAVQHTLQTHGMVTTNES